MTSSRRSCYRIEYTPAAERQIRKLPPPAQKAVLKAIEVLAENPRFPGSKMSGPEGFHRLRTGDYRIIYQIEDDLLLVLVLKVGDRKEIYRRLPPRVVIRRK